MNEEKKEQVKQALKTIGTAGLIGIAAFGVAFGVFYAMHYSAQVAAESKWRQEKQCYKELTRMIRESSPKKASWIEKTMEAEKVAYGDTRFCRALELVHEADVVDYPEHRQQGASQEGSNE